MIQAAMIGLGRWGQSIIGAVQGKSQRLRFVHGVTKEPDLARDFAARHGFRLATDLADALADPAVQAVFLATPHSLHGEQVRAVTATGRPVWCEKPLALFWPKQVIPEESRSSSIYLLVDSPRTGKYARSSPRKWKRAVSTSNWCHRNGQFSGGSPA